MRQAHSHGGHNTLSRRAPRQPARAPRTGSPGASTKRSLGRRPIASLASSHAAIEWTDRRGLAWLDHDDGASSCPVWLQKLSWTRTPDANQAARAEPPDMLAVDETLATWKMRRLLKSLHEAHGEGTSMITMLLPPKFDLARAATKVT